MPADPNAAARETARRLSPCSGVPWCATITRKERLVTLLCDGCYRADAIAAELSQRDEAIRERDAILTAAGYRRCDIPACNCGRWHRPLRPPTAGEGSR